NGILGFFGIRSPSAEMAWVGDMLTRGLAGGIETTGGRAVAAAKDVAEDTLDAMSALTDGLSVPIDTNLEPVTVPQVDLQPVPVSVLHAASSTAGSGGATDVEAIVDATAQRLLSGLDIKVVLNDGTLVGKLAPGLNRQLARINTHHVVLTGG